MTSPISASLVLRRPSTILHNPVRPFILTSTSIEVGGVGMSVSYGLSCDAEGSRRDGDGCGDGKIVLGIDSEMSW